MSELSTKVITGKVRFSFVNVFEPKAFGENETPKYNHGGADFIIVIVLYILLAIIISSYFC